MFIISPLVLGSLKRFMLGISMVRAFLDGADADEEKESQADRAKRWLGIIMVPGAHAVKVEIASGESKA